MEPKNITISFQRPGELSAKMVILSIIGNLTWIFDGVWLHPITVGIFEFSSRVCESHVYVHVILYVHVCVCRENGWRGDSTIGMFGQFGSQIASLECAANKKDNPRGLLRYHVGPYTTARTPRARGICTCKLPACVSQKRHGNPSKGPGLVRYPNS